MVRNSKKNLGLLSEIRKKLLRNDFSLVNHPGYRMGQREVTHQELRYVLLTGYREVKKDKFRLKYHTWNYAIRGKTANGRELRIVVTFSNSEMLIITVIDLEK